MSLTLTPAALHAVLLASQGLNQPPQRTAT